MQAEVSSLVNSSRQFLEQAKLGEQHSCNAIIAQLNQLDQKEAAQRLSKDNYRLPFWMNIYNGVVQNALRQNPELYKNKFSFFWNSRLDLFGTKWSLNKIEHGLLRRSKLIWALGYISNPFPGKSERLFRVDKLDYRVHFALNCAAESCPPIQEYSVEDCDQKLEAATIDFLKTCTKINEANRVVETSKIMFWYLGDFGGKSGIKKILEKHELIPDISWRVKFQKYSWEMDLDNYM